MEGQSVVVEKQVQEKRPGIKLENLETNGDSEREAFRKSLDRSGVTESLMKTVEALMLETVFPSNPMLFVTQFLSDRYAQTSSSKFPPHAPSQLQIPPNHSLLKPKDQSHYSFLTPKAQSSHSSLMAIEQSNYSSLTPKEECNYSPMVHKEEPQLVTEDNPKSSAASFDLSDNISGTTLVSASPVISFYNGSVKTSMAPSSASLNESASPTTSAYNGSVKTSIGNSVSLNNDSASTSVSVSATTISHHGSVNTSGDNSMNSSNDSTRTFNSNSAISLFNGSVKISCGSSASLNSSNDSARTLNSNTSSGYLKTSKGIPLNPNIGQKNRTDKAPFTTTNPVFGVPDSTFNSACGTPKSSISIFNINGGMPKPTIRTFADSGTPFSTNGILPDPPAPFKHLSHLRLPLVTSPQSPPIPPPSPSSSRHSNAQRRDGGRNSLSKAPGSFRRMRNNLPAFPEESFESDTSHLPDPDTTTTDIGSKGENMTSTQSQDNDESKSINLAKSTGQNHEPVIVAKKTDINSNTDDASVPSPVTGHEVDTSPLAPPNSPDNPKPSPNSAAVHRKGSPDPTDERSFSISNPLNLATSLAEKKHLLTKIYHQKQASQKIQIKQRIKKEPPRDAYSSDVVPDLHTPPPLLQNPPPHPHNNFSPPPQHPHNNFSPESLSYQPCINQSNQVTDMYPSAPNGLYQGNFLPPNIPYQPNGAYPPQSSPYPPPSTFNGPFPSGQFQSIAARGPPNGPFQNHPSNGPFNNPTGGSLNGSFQGVQTSGPPNGPYPVNNFVLTGPTGFSVPISGPYSNVFTTNQVTTAANQGWIQPPPVSFNDPSLQPMQTPGNFNGPRENKKRKS